MTPLVSQLWPQFMADPDFAASFGRVIVEHARMLRQERCFSIIIAAYVIHALKHMRRTASRQRRCSARLPAAGL